MPKEKTSKKVAKKASWLMSKDADSVMDTARLEVADVRVMKALTKYQETAKSVAASALTQYEPVGDMKPGSKVHNLACDIATILSDGNINADKLADIARTLKSHGWTGRI